MDDVFDSGIPAWRSGKKTSRIDHLATEIQQGTIKVAAGDSDEKVAEKV